MAFPGQRVQIGGAGEVFVVLRVDSERLEADLLRHGSVNSVETGIPLSVLTEVKDAGSGDPMKASA